MRELMVCIALSGCTVGNAALVDSAGQPPDQARTTLPDSASAPDMLGPAADLLPPAALDLAPAPADLSPASSPDLSPAAADLSPAPDLEPPPACGKMGQPCCAGSCESGMLCLYSGAQCGGARSSVCTMPQNCGGPGLKCCDSLGQPTSIGFCEASASCSSGACHSC